MIYIYTGMVTSSRAGNRDSGGLSCGCTCPSSWMDPPGWTAGTPGPVAVIHFEDTSCFDYHDGLESQIKVSAHVSIQSIT